MDEEWEGRRGEGSGGVSVSVLGVSLGSSGEGGR